MLCFFKGFRKVVVILLHIEETSPTSVLLNLLMSVLNEFLVHASVYLGTKEKVKNKTLAMLSLM